MVTKDAVVNWSDECQQSFEALKRQITSKRVLSYFNVKCPTIVSTDASAVALGSVLSQIQAGKEGTIAVASRELQSNE